MVGPSAPSEIQTLRQIKNARGLLGSDICEEKLGLDTGSDHNADLSKFWSTPWGIPEKKLLIRGAPC